MRRRRPSPSASFDLFLDAVCNTFGGILFIAILIAVQVRQTQSQSDSQPPCSPEVIAELQSRYETLLADVDSASGTLETIRKTMPTPVSEDDRKKVDLYTSLAAQQKELIGTRNEQITAYLAQVHHNATLLDKLSKLEEEMKRLDVNETQLEEVLRTLQAEEAKLKREQSALQGDADDLAKKVAQKQDQVKDKQNPDKNSREEELYLPKMQAADKGKRMVYFVVRHQKLYAGEDRSSFGGGPTDYLNFPNPSAGIPLTPDSTAAVTRLLERYSPSTAELSFLTYPDSFEIFYLVRDQAIKQRFKYEPLPTTPDAYWTFGGTRSGSVQ